MTNYFQIWYDALSKKFKILTQFIFWLAKQIKLKRNIPKKKKPNNEDHKSNFLYVRFAKVNFYVV